LQIRLQSLLKDSVSFVFRNCSYPCTRAKINLCFGKPFRKSLTRWLDSWGLGGLSFAGVVCQESTYFLTFVMSLLPSSFLFSSWKTYLKENRQEQDKTATRNVMVSPNHNTLPNLGKLERTFQLVLQLPQLWTYSGTLLTNVTLILPSCISRKILIRKPKVVLVSHEVETSHKRLVTTALRYVWICLQLVNLPCSLFVPTRGNSCSLVNSKWNSESLNWLLVQTRDYRKLYASCLIITSSPLRLSTPTGTPSSRSLSVKWTSQDFTSALYYSVLSNFPAVQSGKRKQDFPNILSTINSSIILL
jgi:hypothetical protein